MPSPKELKVLEGLSKEVISASSDVGIANAAHQLSTQKMVKAIQENAEPEAIDKCRQECVMTYEATLDALIKSSRLNHEMRDMVQGLTKEQ